MENLNIINGKGHAIVMAKTISKCGFIHKATLGFTYSTAKEFGKDLDWLLEPSEEHKTTIEDIIFMKSTSDYNEYLKTEFQDINN